MPGWTSSKRRRKIRDYVFDRENGKCFYCGKICIISNSTTREENTATIDHIISRKNGGHATDRNNCVLSCWKCNNEKAEKDAFSFLKDKMERPTSPPDTPPP